MSLQLFQPYRNLIFQTLLTLSLSFLLILLKVPIFFLHGLFTYIHPDHLPRQQNGVKAAIRRPSDSNSTLTQRRNHKSKDKFEFDENKAQIFRLKLDQPHLRSRIFFNDYWYCFVFSFVALSSLLLNNFSGFNQQDGILVPVVLGFICLCKLFMCLGRLAFEKSASKRSDKQLSVLFGVLGFILGCLICSGAARAFLDFDFGSIDAKWKFFISVLMGCFAGILYMPAATNARAFWLGTDQLRSNLSMVYCGWFARMILYVSFLLAFFSTLLWITPLFDILINKSIDNSSRTHLNSSANDVRNTEKSPGNEGFIRSDFTNFRLWCLLLSGLIQIIALRPNLQMYLNEALLSWYQRLHASKVPDLDFSRAKVFLHNHYLCLVVLQFFAPPILLGGLCFSGRLLLQVAYSCTVVAFCFFHMLSITLEMSEILHELYLIMVLVADIYVQRVTLVK
ncbi:uncharacterized protein LOC126673020 [Mercurialis annua]|uniref:uncharacterized protein LOC126673020 n=1 Tax=Mercurialis annua TaxID=3986 RepID=UPI002160F2FF|nr:uncharacterized protein LOC126673020 [Mercurialis annua]